MFLPLTANVFPNTTVRLLVDAGRNPGGVNAVAAPASTTRRNREENMVAAQNSKGMGRRQKVSRRTIKKTIN
jgi:hypothetical protein